MGELPQNITPTLGGKSLTTRVSTSEEGDDGPEDRALGSEVDGSLAFPSQLLLAFCFLTSTSGHSNT